MTKFRFDKDYDFSPKAMKGHVTTAYKAGQEVTVTQEAVEAATAAGVGQVVGDTATKDKPDAGKANRGG